MIRLAVARSLAVAIAALACLLAMAGAASAHAALTATSPFDGESVESAPRAVTLEFNEPVTAPTGGIRVYDATGERVDDGAPRNTAADALRVGLSPDLADGGYIVTWRAVSADGHAIKGAFVFSVGGDAAVDDDLLARLFAGDSDTAVGVLAGIVRAASYAGALLAAGALLFLAGVGAPDDGDVARAWAGRGAAVALTASVTAIPLQAMATTGFGPVAALAPDVLNDTLASPFGVATLIRAAALTVVLVGLRASVADGRTRGPIVTAAAAVAIATFVIDGHTRTVDPAWLMVASDAMHLAAGAVWLGGLVVLAAAVREHRLDDDPVGAARLVARWSRLATVAVAGVTVAGFAMAWATVRVLRALTSTAYGWSLLVKVALAAIVIGLGAYNHRRLVPAVAARLLPAGGSDDAPTVTVPGARARAAWRQLRTTVRVEAAVLVVLLLVTGFLVNQRPAAEEAGVTGAYETYVDLAEGLEVNLVVDPNEAGLNAIHMYLLDRTGRPVADVDDVRLLLTMPTQDIGPIERVPFVAGPGHWQLNGRDLAIPGTWTIEVVVGEDRFTEHRAEIPVVVNAP